VENITAKSCLNKMALKYLEKGLKALKIAELHFNCII